MSSKWKDDLRFYVLFDSNSVISGGCLMVLIHEASFTFGQNLAVCGTRSAIPYSIFGSANQMATRRLLIMPNIWCAVNTEDSDQTDFAVIRHVLRFLPYDSCISFVNQSKNRKQGQGYLLFV